MENKKEKKIKKADELEAKEYVLNNKFRNKWVVFLEEFHTHKIEKSGVNNFQKYKYYKVEDIEKVLIITQIKTGMNLTLVKQNPFFIEGLEYMRFEYEFNDGQYTFEFIFKHDNTHKNLIQSSGSTSTYGHRYSLMRLLGVSEDIDDPDSEKNQVKASKGKTKVKKENIKTPTLKDKKIITNETFADVALGKGDVEEEDYVETEVKEVKEKEVDKDNDIDFDMDF